MGKGCGNSDCGVSTGIHGGLTFGSGDLDPNGFWEHPCEKCARWAEEHHPEDGRCWHFGPPTRKEMLIAESHFLEDAKGCLRSCLGLLSDLVGEMRDRKAGEDGSESYHKEFSARYDEGFLGHDVSDLIESALSELEKVKVPND